MPESTWTSQNRNYRSKQRKVYSEISYQIQQLKLILCSGNKVLKTALQNSPYAAGCIQRFVGTALNRFISAKLEILVNARNKLIRSRRCKKCIKEAKCTEEVKDIVWRSNMNFDRLESEMTAVLKKAVREPEDGKVEKQKSSHPVIAEFIKCINTTKGESSGPDAAVKISREASAKLKDQLNKASKEEETDDEAEFAKVQLASEEIQTRIANFLSLSSEESTLYSQAGDDERMILSELSDSFKSCKRVYMPQALQLSIAEQDGGCINCLADQVKELRVKFESDEQIKYLITVVDGVKDSVEPTRHMTQKNITQEFIDKEEPVCCVCMSEFVLKDTSATGCPSCKNLYHEKCISRWLSDNKGCPYCRYKLRSQVTISTQKMIYIN